MSPSTTSPPRSGLAVGFIVFAGVAMVMIGAFHALQGMVALFNDDFYVVGQKWIFEFDLTTWGWIHLLVGLLVLVAGFFVFQGAVWARAVGIAVAAVSAVLNFMWLPHYPIWSLIIIALDVLVIWALSVHGRDFTRCPPGPCPFRSPPIRSRTPITSAPWVDPVPTFAVHTTTHAADERVPGQAFGAGVDAPTPVPPPRRWL